MSKISALTEGTSIVATDLFRFVDVSDTTMAASGTNKKATAQTLINELAQLIAPTWNNAGTDFTALKVNVTNTASGASSKLLDLQVGGVSKVNADKNGVFQALSFKLSDGSYIDAPNAEQGFRLFSNSGELCFRPATNQLGLPQDTFIHWGLDWFLSGSNRTSLGSPAANILAQRNGTNPQTSQLYRAYTDDSNYERLAMQSGAGYFEVAAETAGTGTDNIDLKLTPAGTGNVQFGTHSAVGAETVTGFITIKDAGGTSRKIAVIS